MGMARTRDAGIAQNRRKSKTAETSKREGVWENSNIARGNSKRLAR